MDDGHGLTDEGWNEELETGVWVGVGTWIVCSGDSEVMRLFCPVSIT